VLCEGHSEDDAEGMASHLSSCQKQEFRRARQKFRRSARAVAPRKVIPKGWQSKERPLQKGGKGFQFGLVESVAQSEDRSCNLGNWDVRAGSGNSAGGTGKPGRMFGQARRADRGDGSALGRMRSLRACPRVVERHASGFFGSLVRMSCVADLGYVVVASKTNSLLVR